LREKGADFVAEHIKASRDERGVSYVPVRPGKDHAEVEDEILELASQAANKVAALALIVRQNRMVVSLAQDLSEYATVVWDNIVEILRRIDSEAGTFVPTPLPELMREIDGEVEE